MVPRLHFRLLPSLSQVLPALFRRVPLRSDLANSFWKAHCWLVWALHEDDGSLVTLCGTRVVPGDGKTPHLCLECRRIVCVNPRSITTIALKNLAIPYLNKPKKTSPPSLSP